MSGGERPSPSGRRSGSAGAEGRLIREVPGRLGAALTKPGRASTARWCGSGERDRKEYVRNRCRKASQRFTGSNLVDVGRERCVPAVIAAVGELPGGEADGPEGRAESLRRRRGETAGAESGSSSIKRTTVNTGTTSGLALHHKSIMDGWAGFIVDRSARGGAESP